MIESIKRNKIPTIIACIQWVVTNVLGLERLYFVGIHNTKIYLIEKVLYLLFLIAFWDFLFFVYRRYKQNDTMVKRGVQVFCVYFTIMFVLLLILWPGTWSWDDIWVLNSMRQYEWLAWQHVLTGMIQMVFLQIMPFPGGIIFMQNLIISVIVSYIIVKVEKNFWGNGKLFRWPLVDTLIKLIPFILPPVLMYQFSGYRMGLYSYLELALLCFFACSVKEDKKWNAETILTIGLLTVVVASWRSESIFYIPVVCFLIFLQKKEKLSLLKKIGAIAIIVIGFMGIQKIQDWAQGNSNYEIVSTLPPCVAAVRAADEEMDEALLEDIGKVICLDIVYENPKATGDELYWGYDLIKADYSKDEYKAYLVAFLKLSIKYPEAVISERWEIFIDSTQILGDTAQTNVQSAAILFDDNNNSAAAEFKSWGSILNRPIFEGLRKGFIRLLGCARSDFSVYPIYKIIWNTLIPMLLVVASWLCLVFRKQWYYALVGLATVIKIPIIALTQPNPWFMYHLSSYLLGYIALIYVIIYMLCRKKEKRVTGEQCYE